MNDKETTTDPTDPQRCQGIAGKNQCNNVQVPGSNFCHSHGGFRTKAANDQKDLRLYDLAIHRDRMDQLRDHAQSKSLRDEIGILRIVLERVIIKNPDLHLAFGPIGDLVTKIEKLVVSCHRLEEKTGVMMDKAQLLAFASKVIDAVASEISDEDQLNRIGNRIIDLTKEDYDSSSDDHTN